jgi:hypothetical protein
MRLLGTRVRALLVASSAVLAALSSTGCGDAGAQPAQPIPFPHARHTENQIDCAFCHEYSERQASAGIPRTELCGTCHSAMPQDSEAAKKLMERVDAGQEIPWVRVYRIPQHAYFPHKWHVRAGIDCAECHGDVATSLTVVRHLDLKMAWCVDCHEARQVSVDCVLCHK